MPVRNDGAIGPACRGDDDLLGELLGDFVRVVLVDTGSEQELLPPLDVGGAIAVAVLVWVGRLVFEDLDEFVEAGRNNGTKDRSNPVDPVVAGEGVIDHCWTEGTSGVERSTGEVNASQLGNEERKPNTWAMG